MKRTGIFYGSTTGTTQSIAETLAGKLGIASCDVHDVSALTDEMIHKYDVLLMGTSTWGEGEVQDDWYLGLKKLKSIDLKGKVIALFGCGDAESYPDTFCDGIGVIYEDLHGLNCEFVGFVPDDDYHYISSIAVKNHYFVGLAIDEVNESHKTDERIDKWVEKIKPYCV